jgi:hypothetical protein
MFDIHCDLHLEVSDSSVGTAVASLSRRIQMPFVPMPDTKIIFESDPTDRSEPLPVNAEGYPKVAKTDRILVRPIYGVRSLTYCERDGSIMIKLTDAFRDYKEYAGTIQGLIEDYGFKFEHGSDPQKR